MDDRQSVVSDIARAWGVEVAPAAVCAGHCAPLDFLTDWVCDGPPITVVHGPRGGGKSYLRALATHIDSINYHSHQTRILGGSLAQSEQIYNALREFQEFGRGIRFFKSFTRTRATYCTGSDVAILAASRTSVRGPHVPTLCLDEVDELKPELRESAVGMCMDRKGVAASISITSTYHNINGPMAELIAKAESGDFPLYKFCIFEVLETCTDERSGEWVGGEVGYERCPECPIKRWCHDERDRYGEGNRVGPKAKRSQGHYSIEAFIQKVNITSLRIFEADYLCRGPRADGLWFTQFDESIHVTTAAEYDPRHPPPWVAVDSGVWTGAVWFQVVPRRDEWGREVPNATPIVNVFADYLAEGKTAEVDARDIIEVGRARCNGNVHRYATDPAGGARNPVGPTVIYEYERAGMRPLERWPTRPVADGLALVEALVMSADGSVNLRIHPRCVALVRAFKSYHRAKRANQWMDWPEDPQHPAEDVMDALRGGLVAALPEGRRPRPKLNWVNSRNVF